MLEIKNVNRIDGVNYEVVNEEMNIDAKVYFLYEWDIKVKGKGSKKYINEIIEIVKAFIEDEKMKEYEKQRAELEAERQKRENEYNANVTIEKIENYKTINVADKDIFVKALEPSVNKNDWKKNNDKYIDESAYMNKYKITDIVILEEVEYNYFCYNFMNDFEFLNDKGGSWVDDETRELLYNYAVAVTCEGKETLIIDPQGYSYARYTCRLIEDIDGMLQNEINAAIVVNNETFNNKINEVVDKQLYIIGNEKEFINYKKHLILNDERIILNKYYGKVAVTGKALKELIFECKGLRIENIEEMAIKTTIEVFAEGVIKMESGLCFELLPSKENPLKNISFSERLKNELERAKGENTPEDPDKKKIKKETTKEQKVYTNVVNVDFTQRQAVTVNKSVESATSRQMYALYCITKINNKSLNLDKVTASNLISRAKNGEDIKPIIQNMINAQKCKAN